ncbi:polysaccharide deacetylase family protein [Pseudoalteromonas sp. SG45-5]|uniref:polysaccharide deacetylase family protein n=1 Tax=unclassified Pseudoalteromonas TaxID=194690 RepID=UPI0015F9B25C|nr:MULTISPECIES: polysaccharide deacetylase family protein [unclassified Pseudoalteromonas]MBB1385217.1 polysaccharide deacetylase family protein [Pseudoalteromonas sp. SG45-5]MBB1393159.1 polysaccharide deacetylase family protein [Pseudoalteromonas sp. SG44-4]MBB1445591.1 polysaccharide deacetylase family protein [Pseudoalteromonas sp. SG41-6]
MYKKLFHLVLFTLISLSLRAQAAVILQYHHVSETLPAVTSVSADTFTKHLNYLKDNNFNVIPLNKLLSALQQGQTLPEKTIAITFDDGYNNNYDEAAPILEQFGYPYTIFVNPKLIDEGQSYVMGWDKLKELSKKGALISNHSAQHNYLHIKLENETTAQWKVRIKQDILHSQQRIKEEIGQDYKYLAYPYGEFSNQLQTLITELGFIGIGQHSGAVSKDSNFSRLPRFPASGFYSNLETLTTKINSRAFSITNLTYQDSVTQNNPPKLTIEFKMGGFHKTQFACYVSSIGQANLNWINKNTVEVTSPQALKKGRSRFNCTAPSIENPSSYYWFSQPWVIQ